MKEDREVLLRENGHERLYLMFEDEHTKLYYLIQTAGEADRKVRREILLNEILHVSPGDLVYGEHGKPYLKDGSVFFSLSHDEDASVLAVSDVEVGVDIERAGKKVNWGVVKKAFPKDYADDLEFISKHRHPEDLPFMFTRYWTCIEAMVKADGRGLTLDIKNNQSWINQWNLEHRIMHGFIITVATRKEK